MNKFFGSYFYEDKFIVVDAINANKLFEDNPNLFKCYEYIAPELNELNKLREIFMNKYKLAISFHPHYQLYKNIESPSRSVQKSKSRFLKSTLSFSIASKSKALLVPFETDEFIYIPYSLRDKKIYIENLDLFTSHTSTPIFHTKKPTRKELICLIEQLILLNNKLNLFEERHISLTLLPNEACWNKAFFSIK